MAPQLYRAAGSIGATVAEGYSRSSGLDRVRFYEYALGSARETREWYLHGEPVLGTARGTMAMDVLTRISKLLLASIPQERKRLIRPTTRLPKPTTADENPSR